MGAKGRPFYRVVVADQRAPRDGRFIENIGRYQPLNDPSLIEIDPERALHWLRVGAQPSNQVRNLMEKVGIWETFVSERPKAAAMAGPAKPERLAKEKLSKKAQAKAAASETTASAAPAPPETPAAAAHEEPSSSADETAAADEASIDETSTEETSTQENSTEAVEEPTEA